MKKKKLGGSVIGIPLLFLLNGGFLLMAKQIYLELGLMLITS